MSEHLIQLELSLQCTLHCTRYLNMVLESDWHDDMDVARAVHSPHGNIHIGSPYLDPRYIYAQYRRIKTQTTSFSLFNPLATTGTHLASLPGTRRQRRWPVLPRFVASYIFQDNLLICVFFSSFCCLTH